MAQVARELVAVPWPRVPSLPALPQWRVVSWLASLALLVALAAASYLAYTGSVSTSTYEIQRFRTERDGWRVRNEQLRLELAKVRSITWVEHEAVARLGMQKPTQLIYVRIESPTQLAGGSDNQTAASAR